ncbi:anti-phage protein KwaA [Pasteurella multocida]
MKSIFRKINLYIISLSLLFVFFIIISFQLPECWYDYRSLDCWRNLIVSNLLSVISLAGVLYAFVAYLYFDFTLKGATDIPFTISKLDDINYEHLTFLATYIVPLISFDFQNSRQLIVLGLLLIVMCIIYIKTDLFYANPTLALLGFRIYKADGNFKFGGRDSIILISKEKLKKGQKVSYIKLDDRIYYVRGFEHGNE